MTQPSTVERRAGGEGSEGGERRALITGIAGQDGSYLAELLLSKGYRVTGMVHASGKGERGGSRNDDPESIGGGSLGASEHLRSQLELIGGDLLEHETLWAVVDRVRPHELYHLAAPSYVPASWEDPAKTMTAIAGATAALLEAVRAIDREIRVFVASSSAMFGAAPQSPQREDTVCRPETPYAVAKLAGHQLVGLMREHEESRLWACSGILYNHESPRRPEQFVTRKVSRAAAAVKLGREREVALGDLASVRDWSFAGDVMRGAWLMLQAERPADYVLASGVGHTVEELAQVAFAHVGLRAEDHIRVDQKLVRPDATELVGDPARAWDDLGWRAELGFEELVARMVDADLRALRATLG